ncbi:amidohydrolase family protein [Sphingopyxis sp. J-6]|uniref:amidohydrolase family protein n=1 Tax=Sphingopyxis sp. J-6 TaxID=3122054 RepID=UPI003983F140
MKTLASLIALALAMPAAAQTLAVTHAEAWTMEGDAPVKDATIVIENGRIVSVAAGGAAPADARVIDARGKPVTPGLVNGATQIGLVEIAGSSDTVDTSSADDRNPGYDVSRALNGNSTLVSLARADGLTRALVYPSPSRRAPFNGEPAFARLRDGVDILDVANVGVYTVIGGGAWDRIGSRGAQWDSLRKALTEAKRGADGPSAAEGKKDRKRPSPPPHGGPGGRRGGEELLAAVLRGEVPLAIQTHRESDIRQAAALAGDFGIRVIIVGGAEAWRVADQLAAAKVAVIVDPQVNLPFNFDQLGARQDNAALLAKAGVMVAVGQAGGVIHTNYNAGMGLREGAGIAVANGLPYAEALKAVTVNPLAIWGRGGGTLTPGADADLVIWDGDPLEPSTNALSVIVEGRETAIRSRQDQLAERYREVR